MSLSGAHNTEPVQRTIDSKERTGQPHVVIYGSSRFVASGVANKIKQNLENYGYTVTRRYPDMPGAEKDISVARNIRSGDAVLAGVDVEMFGENNVRYNEWLRAHPRVGYFSFKPYTKPHDGGPFLAGAEINSAKIISDDEDRVAAYIASQFDTLCQSRGIDSVKRKISGQLATTLNIPSLIIGGTGGESGSGTTTSAISPTTFLPEVGVAKSGTSPLPPLSQLEKKELSYEEAGLLLINIMKTAPQVTCFFLQQQIPELHMTISKDMDGFKEWFLLQYGIELKIEFDQALNFKDPPEKGSFVIRNIQAKAFDHPVIGTVCRVWLMRAMENLLEGFEKKIPVQVPAALLRMINMMLLTRQLERKGSPFLYKSFNSVDATIVWVEEPEFSIAFVQSVYNEKTYP